jgi:hypothetical protein
MYGRHDCVLAWLGGETYTRLAVCTTRKNPRGESFGASGQMRLQFSVDWKGFTPTSRTSSIIGASQHWTGTVVVQICRSSRHQRNSLTIKAKRVGYRRLDPLGRPNQLCISELTRVPSPPARIIDQRSPNVLCGLTIPSFPDCHIQQQFTESVHPHSARPSGVLWPCQWSRAPAEGSSSGWPGCRDPRSRRS